MANNIVATWGFKRKLPEPFEDYTDHAIFDAVSYTHLALMQQMPRTIISTRTPAQLASLILLMICGSLMELFFKKMCIRDRTAAAPLPVHIQHAG